MVAVASSQATVGNINIKRQQTQHIKSNQIQTFISTDKPLYKTNEKVYIRAVLLDATSHEPSLGNEYVAIQIKNSRGQVVANGATNTQEGIWSYGWNIPAGQAGGEYTISVAYPGRSFSSAERKIEVRAYRAPRIKTQIVFAREGYGPGERVSATLYSKRAEGGVPEGAKVTIKPLVDGVEVPAGTGVVDSKGLCRVNFNLPQKIEKGDGTLALVIEDGGVVETASKTIPILLQSVDLQMFPEGGDLIAGFKNRVYVQAFLPNGKPADLTANIITAQKGQNEQPVAFRTEHEGRGRFEFTPKANKQYYLKIVKPSGIKRLYALPKAKASGVVIHTDNDTIKNGQPVKLSVNTTSSCRITISKRNKELGSRIVSAGGTSKRSGTIPISVAIPADVDGALTVTAFDEFGKPVAERLVFHEPSKPLTISVHADKPSYAPGDTAKVTIKTTDSSGKPVPAVVGVSVTDDSVLQMLEKRDRAPRLPVMVFLEPEVKDLADAQFYLDPANPKAGMATDLLLGTQGWRRFAYLNTEQFIEKYGEKARRIVAFAGNSEGNWNPQQAQRPRHNYHLLNEVSPRDKKGHLVGPSAGAALGTGAGRWSGTPIGGGRGTASPLWRKGVEQGGRPGARFSFAPSVYKIEEPVPPLRLPEELGRVEGPRDVNMFQVEPTVIDERRYSTGRAERHQKTSPTLPEGAPFPDGDGALAQLSSVDKYAFNAGPGTRNHMFAVREFAHRVKPNRKPTDREDFSETLFWNAGIKTNDRNGEATINFDLSDNITSFQIAVDGFTNEGAVGSKLIGIKSLQPFYAEAKLPLEVTDGDQILLPVNLINGTGTLLSSIGLNIEMPSAFKLSQILKMPQQLKAGERARCIQPITVGLTNEPASVTINARAANSIDKVVREISVKPSGFPVERAAGGILEPGKSVKFKVKIDDNYMPSSLSLKSEIYPAPLANLTSALERLIQDPCGCFEQTSSTSYPLTMAQQYFKSHADVDPKLVRTSSEKLEEGYKKLVSFWCPDRGYEWFGKNPGHEPLTAYGLMHFADMAKVRPIDQGMFNTTHQWLMNQKDGKGGFTRKATSLHTWTEDKDCSNAYIIWALLETGEPTTNLKLELETLKTASNASQNSYVIALAANAFDLAGDKAQSQKLMKRLAELQRADGGVDKMTNSVVGSSGETLELEGAALSTLAWLRNDQYVANVERSMKFLADSCKAGRYGSTQSTVLSLRAILAYDKKHSHPKAAGKVLVFADGNSIGEVAFDQKSESSIKLPDFSKALTAGEHEIELRMEAGSTMPYSVAANYNRATPDSSSKCKVDMKVKLDKEKMLEGSPAEALITITNKTNAVIPMPISIVGLPGGLEPRHNQLKELVKSGKVDAYEVRGREVVFYWRSLDKNEKKEIPISVIAAVPGKYTGPASRAYLYYADEHKKWVDGLRVEIAAK